MPPLGARAAIDLVLPSSIDSSRVLAFSLRNGMTAAEMIARAVAACSVKNEAIIARYGGLIYLTQSQYAYYTAGSGDGRRKTPKKVEFKMADGVRSEQNGHMLPIEDFVDATAWTPEYLRDAWEAQLNADIQVVTDSWQNRFDSQLLTRALTDNENAIGSGYDVPWAIGTGTNVNYIPPQYGSYPAFDSTHSHFIGQAGGVNATQANLILEKAVAHLRHHGHTGRLTALVSETDVAAYAGITGGKFVRFVPQGAGIQPVTGASGAPVFISEQELSGMPGEIFGLFLSELGPTVLVRAHEGIPTAYGFVSKSYGVNNPKNGIAVREHPAQGFGILPDPILTKSINPQLEYIQFKGVHGVGVNDRLNGVAYYMGGASWVDASIS